ncbi:MAG: hypothetical protein AAGF68_00410 [Pseudomonadota bacterium]
MAFAVLFSWLIVAIVLFKRLPLQLAIICTIVGGHLLLPSETRVAIDLPLLPQIDKILLPSVAAMLMAMVVMRQNAQTVRHRTPTQDSAPGMVLPGWIPRSKIGFVLSLMLAGGVVMMVLTNSDPVRYPGVYLPGQRPYDIFSQLLYWGVLFLPMLLGRKFLADTEGHRLLLVVLCLSAFFYSFLALYEVRMSPRLNEILYGFFPHDWQQHRRGGGWRPIVFLNHGLILGIYMASAVIAAAMLVRISSGSAKAGYAALLVWLAGALLLGKTLGALILAMIFVPLALLAPVRIQLLVATIVAGVVILYPMLRGASVVPLNDIVAFFEGVAPDRAGSLAFRFENEEMLLAHANERPLFGWSGWSRWRVFDPDTGQDITTVDGFWVITIGESGWIGYLARFGLFCGPLIVFFLRRKRFSVGLPTAGLCLVTAATLFDLLPNASATPVFFLTVGALLGRLELQSEAAADAAPEVETQSDRRARPRARSPEQAPANPANTPQPVSEPATRYSRFAPTKRRES